MRPIDTNGQNALKSTRSGDKLLAYVWYGGQLVYPDPLPVTGWKLDWDDTRQVQTGSVDIRDGSGKLAPWLLEDALGVGGSRLQIVYQIGGTTNSQVPIGWYRITHPQPVEKWQSYIIDSRGQVNRDSLIPPGKKLAIVSGGATIQVDFDDLAVVIKNARLLAPDSPQGTSPTVVGEIKRLLADIVPVVTTSGVVDIAVSKSLVYKDDRLNAVEDLCTRIGCGYRMNGYGQFEIYPLASQATVWSIATGPEQALMEVNRAQEYTGLYNVFVVDGTATVPRSDGTTAQVPIRSIAKIESGPLRWNGPHGMYPTFYSSNMITTQADADAYAQQMMTTQLRGLTVDLLITCLPNPALQLGDWVNVANPVVNLQTVSLNGRIKKMSLASKGTAVDKMKLTVTCTYADVQAALAGVNRG